MSILIGLAHEPIFNAVWSSAASFQAEPSTVIAMLLLSGAILAVSGRSVRS